MRDWLDKHWSEALSAFQRYSDDVHEQEDSE